MPPKKTQATRKPAKVVESDSDDESDSEDEPPKKLAAKPAKGKPAKVVESDSDSDEDDKPLTAIAKKATAILEKKTPSAPIKVRRRLLRDAIGGRTAGVRIWSARGRSGAAVNLCVHVFQRFIDEDDSDDESLRKKKRRRVINYGPNAPKRPLSPYLYFCAEWREKVGAPARASRVLKVRFAPYAVEAPDQAVGPMGSWNRYHVCIRSIAQHVTCHTADGRRSTARGGTPEGTGLPWVQHRGACDGSWH
jgi:hypothetical protein